MTVYTVKNTHHIPFLRITLDGVECQTAVRADTGLGIVTCLRLVDGKPIATSDGLMECEMMYGNVKVEHRGEITPAMFDRPWIPGTGMWRDLDEAGANRGRGA